VSLKTRLAAAAAAAAIAGLLAAGLGASHRKVLPSDQLAALPASPAPALEVGKPAGLPSRRYLSRWTIVRRPTLARAAPTASSSGTAALWVKVRLPVLPSGSVGWVPRRALGPYETVNTRLVVDRGDLQATLYRQGKIVFAAPVGVGTHAWPTPAGEFSVRSKLTRYASPFYGPLAFGTTARSDVLTDWPGGGFVGIHGTNEPQLLPGRISHGCVRFRNRDLLRLAALMPIGTPLTIR
jgi:lipoprotein-anchoring transpeptidase ErfK/SrfK